ncbi:hypothetical protein L208DRAFT_1383043 [Tricholoma matsutake]|nr:hypothetical protein L208DRAFT_1383043 [Tricholoma matsutake 945]
MCMDDKVLEPPLDNALSDLLLSYADLLVCYDLHKILLSMQDLHMTHWCIAYLVISLSMVCMLGTAFISITTAVVMFNASTLAQKANLTPAFPPAPHPPHPHQTNSAL